MDFHNQLRYNIYTLFSDYCGENLLFSKIKNSPDGFFSFYYASIKCMILERRYIIAIVPGDTDMPGTQSYLRDLEWISLQFRSLNEEYNIPTQSHVIGNVAKENFKHIVVTKTSEEKNGTHYDTDQLPIKIMMIHTSTTSFPARMPLLWALKDFKTVVTFEHTTPIKNTQTSVCNENACTRL